MPVILGVVVERSHDVLEEQAAALVNFTEKLEAAVPGPKAAA